MGQSELDELKKILESKTPARPWGERPSPKRTAASPALNGTPISRRFDAAASSPSTRATTSSPSNSPLGAYTRKDATIAELQSALKGKEKTIESQRDTLAGTRRALEDRISRLERDVGARDAKLRDVKSELESAMFARTSAENALEAETTAAKAMRALSHETEKAMKSKEIDLLEELKREREERRRDAVALAVEREKVAALTEELTRCKARESATSDALRSETETRRETLRKLNKYRRHNKDREARDAALAARRDANEEDVSSLREALARERKGREEAERWLKTELEARDEMTGLFTALRDVAGGKAASGGGGGGDRDRGGDARERARRRELETTRAREDREIKARRDAFEDAECRLHADNDALSAEIEEARATIATRLSTTDGDASSPPGADASETMRVLSSLECPEGWDANVRREIPERIEVATDKKTKGKKPKKPSSERFKHAGLPFAK